MSAMIESLENRTFLSTSTDVPPQFRSTAVQAAIAELTASQTSLSTSQEQFAATLAADKQAIKDRAALGKQEVSAAKAAIKAAPDDASEAAARAQLADARSRLVTDLGLLKADLKADAAWFKTLLKNLRSELKLDTSQFKADLKAAKSAFKQNRTALVRQYKQIAADAVSPDTATPEEVDQLTAALQTAIVGATPPDPQAVKDLATASANAIADGSLSSKDLAALADSALVVLNSANISQEEAQAVGVALRNILGSGDSLDLTEINQLISKVKDYYNQFIG